MKAASSEASATPPGADREPAQRFLIIAAALTALSCVPSVALPPDTATKLTLVATHLIAAAILVPVLARRTAR